MGVRMIGQHLDHAALGDAPLAATLDHALEFALERRERRDLAPDLVQTTTRDAVGLGAGLLRLGAEREQLAHRLERKAELARVADEGEAAQVLVAVDALIAGGA